jgi:hypothetical protein
MKHKNEAVLCISLDNRGNGVSFHTKISSEMFEFSENRQAELNDPSFTPNVGCSQCALRGLKCQSWGKVVIRAVLVAILNSRLFRLPHAFNSGTEGLSKLH